MQNFKIREQLDQLPGGCGMRPPEKLDRIREKTLLLTRYIAANAKGEDPIKDLPEVRTAYCDLLALITELDLSNQLQESEIYYKYSFKKIENNDEEEN